MPKETKHAGGKKKGKAAQPSSESDTAFYRWGIIYIAKFRRFQCHVLESDEDHGVVGLKKALHVDNVMLTKVTRMKPYRLHFADTSNPNGDRVYLFATVRKGKSKCHCLCKGVAQKQNLSTSSRSQYHQA